MSVILTVMWYVACLQHIDKVFKHKELQQQLMDAKLQRITEMMKEVEEKQQRERDFVRRSPLCERSFHYQMTIINHVCSKLTVLSCFSC